jgi:hypothetical protein
MAKQWLSYGFLMLLVAAAGAQTVTPNINFFPQTNITDQTANNSATCTSVKANYASSFFPTSAGSCQSNMVAWTQTLFPITTISRSGSTVTVTPSGGSYNFNAADSIIINGVTNSTDFPNGTYPVASVPNSTTVTYTQAGAAVSSSGGTAQRKVMTMVFSPVSKNVSNIIDDGVTMHEMVYAHSNPTNPTSTTTRIVFHLMPWFSCGAGCTFIPTPNEVLYNSHPPTGYVSNSQTQVQAQINAMKRLCGPYPCGIMQDWSGAPIAGASSTRKAEDAVMDKIKVAVDGDVARPEAGPNTDFLYSFVLDDSTWKTTATCGTSGQTPSCVEKMIICSMDYAKTPTGTNFTCVLNGASMGGGGYFNDAKFWKVGGNPLIGTFLNQGSFFTQCVPAASCATYNNGTPGSCGASTGSAASSDCWSKVWTGVFNHVNAYPAGQVPQFTWRNTFSHAPASLNQGAIKWQNPSGVDTFWDASGYDSLLATAANSTKYFIAGAWKGNDHAQSSFQNDNLVIGQQCGMTWYNTISRSNLVPTFYPAKPLLAISVNTWNDHEQGSALETGIDPCYDIGATITNGYQLNWTITTRDATYAPLSPLNPTIHHIALYASQDGTTLMRVLDKVKVTASSGTIDLRSLGLPGGTYSIYTKLVFQAGIFTSWAGPTTFSQVVSRPQPKVF